MLLEVSMHKSVLLLQTYLLCTNSQENRLERNWPSYPALASDQGPPGQAPTADRAIPAGIDAAERNGRLVNVEWSWGEEYQVLVMDILHVTSTEYAVVLTSEIGQKAGGSNPFCRAVRNAHFESVRYRGA